MEIKIAKVESILKKIQSSISAYWKNAKLIGKNVLLTFLCTLLSGYSSGLAQDLIF